SLLEKAINEVRFDGNPRTDSISFSPRRGDDPRRPNDLRECKKTLTRPTVFHLMGKLSPTEDYVISDEDLLERICELQSSSRRPERLFDELKKNHLLILGEGYSDWLARVFLRMAKGRRLSATCERYEVLADSKTGGDQSLLTFLDHFSSDTRVFLSGGAAEFVEELWRRWRQRTESDPPAPREAGAHRDMPTNGIFISYASEDRGAVENIATGLARAGLPYWFDREQLGPGDKFLQAIEQYILHDCSLFLAIISKHSENRPRGVFRQEWDWALKVPGQLHPRLNFIVPVVVDDNSVPSRADPRFQHLTYASLPGGQVTPGFIEQLRGTLRH
ncbi:MAG TPA: toll/interleukin-1 receptor domain-containing protein, partial [Gemmataceae bacterium]|nr:toll/interleukin-1 receptor domain-containing protein [Gemmataceae bacterium]